MIHSNITCLAALAIVQQRSVDNPIVISAEGYESDLFSIISEQVIFFPPEIHILLKTPTYGDNNILKLKSLLLKFDSFLNHKLEGELFDLYIPHSRNFLYQIFLTHRLCKSVYYIDEGLLSYTQNFHKQNLRKEMSFVKRFIRLNLFNRTNVLNRVKKDFSCIFRFVVAGSCEEVKLDWPKLNQYSQLNLNNSSLLILDNPVQGGLCSENDYFQYLEHIAKKFKNQKVFIKNHPRDKNLDIIREIFLNYNVEIEIINNNLFIELILLNSCNVRIYGGWSSILFYASTMNISVTSFISDFIKIVPSVSEWIENSLPEAFFKSKIIFNSTFDTTD